MADNRITINAEFDQNYKDLGFIGRVGENDSREIVFDCADALTQFPGASIVCVIKRACDTKPYSAALTEDGYNRILHLLAVENAVAGQIMIELRAVSNDTILKSAMFSGRISESLQGEGDRPGNPVRDVLDRVDIALQSATETQKKLLSALDDVDTAVDGANTAAVNAQTIADTVQAKLDNGEFVGAKGDTYDDSEVRASIDELKGDVAAITPDDTVVDGKPWTSKKTVDSLCMPLEATGNPVQVYPVEGYPLGVKLSWEPTQAGSGDPSPENIRLISGRDAISVTRCGKNLLDLSNAYASAYNITGIKNFLHPNTRYIFRPINSGGIFFAVLITNHLESGKADKQKNLTEYIKEQNAKSFITPEDMTDYPYLVLAGLRSGIADIFPAVEFQIELGTTATPYEPYTGSTTDIALPETVYGGEVDAVSGEGNENTKIITLDGTENFKVNNQSNKTSVFILNFDVPAKPFNGTSAALWIVSSHFIKAMNLYFGNAKPGTIWYNDAGTQMRIAWNPGNNPAATVDEFKAFLAAQYAAGTPVQIAYKMATPTPITATGAQPISALSGVNTLYTDADGVVVTGAEDPKHTINILTDRVAALETAAAGA